jgi:hypothetical protein
VQAHFDAHARSWQREAPLSQKDCSSVVLLAYHRACPVALREAPRIGGAQEHHVNRGIRRAEAASNFFGSLLPTILGVPEAAI